MVYGGVCALSSKGEYNFFVVWNNWPIFAAEAGGRLDGDDLGWMNRDCLNGVEKLCDLDDDKPGYKINHYMIFSPWRSHSLNCEYS